MSTIVLPDLPVEILHYICNYLDISTILRSLRYVCKRLYAIINTYDRYDLNIDSLSMFDIKLVSRHIQFEDIISLSISRLQANSDKLQILKSIFHARRFTRLNSLNIFNINDSDVQKFFDHIRLCQV